MHPNPGILRERPKCFLAALALKGTIRKAPEGRQHVAWGVSPRFAVPHTDLSPSPLRAPPQLRAEPGVGAAPGVGCVASPGPGAHAPGYVLSPPFGGSSGLPGSPQRDTT